MNEKNMSVLDAFLALEDLEDEEVKAPLKEGKGFNVRDDVEMDKAKNFIEHQEKKEPELEVIDVDADSIEHLKNNEEYVGQIVLQCNSCKANRFIKAEDLVPSEGDENVYNIEDECPHCHGIGNGYTLKGQVGKYQTEEPKFENDSLTDEPKFDNEPEEAPAEEPQEQQPEEEEPSEQISFEEPNNDAMETTAEDDTVDMKSTLGDEFDSNDVEYDDTEERPEQPTEEDSLTDNNEDEYEEPLSPVEEPKEDEDKKKEEDLKEDVEQDDQIVSDFTETIIEPENIENVLVFDLDGDEEEQIFEGKFEDLPQDIFNAEFIGFDVGQGKLIINIDSDSTIDELTPTVRSMLNKFLDDFNENISVWDQASGDEVFSGTKQSVLEEYGNEAFLSFEAPERLELKVRNLSLTDSLKTPYQEDLDFANPEEKLISNILKENNLREYRVDKFGSEEYWIAESIKEREDLKHIFENYVKPKSSKLVLEFKNVTGFKDKFDLVAEEENECLTEDLEDDAREEAKKYFEDAEVESVIYGYESRGKFHRLQGDLLEIRNDRELRMATELVKAKYHPTGSVKVLYRDSVSESVDCRNRKELTEAILDCESKGIAYTIKRAVKEGYRYTLIKEEAERGFFTDEEGEIQASDTDSRDIDLADTILRITDDIADTFNAKGAATDKRLIAADILNDLEIITAEQSDKVKSVEPAENLRDVVIEVLTGLNHKIDTYAESEDEDEVEWAEERKEDFETLNGDTFTKDAIEARFQDIDASSAHDIPGVVFPEAETECLREGLIYISADESNLTDDQINKGLDLIDAGELKERIPVALEGEEDLFVVANKGKNYLGHRKDIDNYLNNFRNELANEAISRDEFLKNHPQAAASDKVEDHLEDCLKEAEKRIDTDFYSEGHEFDIDITDIFTEVLKGKVKFNFDVLKAVTQYLMEKLPGMYDYLDFEVESSPKTFRIKYKLKPTNESLNEAKEENFYIVAFDNNVAISQGDNFFNKEGILGNYERLWHWTDKENATKYTSREEAEKDIKLAKDLFAEQCEFVSNESPTFFEVGKHEEDNAVRIAPLSEDELDDFGLNESLNEANSRIRVRKYKQENGSKIQLTHMHSGFGTDAHDYEASAKAAKAEMEKAIDDVLTKNNLTRDDVKIEYTTQPNYGNLIVNIRIPNKNESLNESEEDIGLVSKPADEIFGDDGISNNYSPEVYVDYFSDYGDDWASSYPELRFDIIEPGSASTSEIKIRVTGDEQKVREFIKAHNESIESLVEDGAIDEYCLDWLINEDDIHKVELIESLNESEEDEYQKILEKGINKIDRFNCWKDDEWYCNRGLPRWKRFKDKIEKDTTTSPKEKIRQIIKFLKTIDLLVENSYEATAEDIFGLDMDAAEELFYESLNEAKKDDELPADPEVVKTNVHATLNNLVTDEIEAINGYEEAKAEIADTHIEHKDEIIDTIDHIEDEEQEHIDELIDAASEIPFEKEGHEEIEEPVEEPEIEEEPELEPEDEETLDFDETKFESFINEWFNQNVEDTQVFEAVKGNFTDDGTIILEGKLISEDKEQGVKFTLTPNKEINEDLMDSKKVTTYTVTSTCLPEGLVLKESYLWWHGSMWFKTKEEAQAFIDNYMKPEEECVEKQSREVVKAEELGTDIEKEYPYFVTYCVFDVLDDKSEEVTSMCRAFWKQQEERKNK